MQIVIKWDLEALERVAKKVQQIEGNPTRLLKSIGQTLLNRNEDRHDAEKGPDGQKWQALSPMTLATKRGTKILREDGDLLRFHSQVEGDEVLVGTNDWKAKWHHEGTKPYKILPKRGKVLSFGGVVVRKVNHPGLPARELVGFPPDDQHAVEDVVEDYLTAVLSTGR